jgi:dihydropteroate synthase
MKIGKKTFDAGKKTYIMGILNVTPDSFYDGGMYDSPGLSLKRAEKMILEGADIIDIGGESTRPDYSPVSVSEETDRVCGVIEAVKKNLDVVVSCDTYKALVAEAAVKCGADMINSVYAFDADKDLARVIAAGGVKIVLTANLSGGKTAADVTEFVNGRFRANLETARAAGISDGQIILDPGIGFFRGGHDDVRLLRELKTFVKLPYPLLLGASNKSFIGKALGLPVTERLPATIAVSAYAALCGVSFLRVHNVKENRQAVDMITLLSVAGGEELR